MHGLSQARSEPQVTDHATLQVLSWALSPVMASWQGQDYNNAVSSLAAFQATFMPLQGTLPNGMVQVPTSFPGTLG